MVVTVNNSLTLREFLQLPETKPSQEFIDGQIIPKPMPQGKHSTIQGDLVPAINASLKPQRIARAYPELRCTFGSRSLVPDVSVFLWENIPRDGEGKVMNYPAASGRGIRIKIDSIVDFGVAAGILGFSLLGMVR
jgi:Uma2 family endonuclease